MGDLKIILVLGFVCFALCQAAENQVLDKSGSEIRLKLTSGEFAQLCQLKKQNFNNNLKDARTSLATVSKTIDKKIGKLIIPADSSILLDEILVGDYCTENADLKEALKKLLTAVQLCLNEEDNLSDEEEKNIIENAASVHCFGSIKYTILRKLHSCVDNQKTKSALAKCYKNPLNLFGSSQEFLYPLPIKRTESQCKIADESAKCQINAVKKHCNFSVAIEFETMINNYIKISNCVH